MAFEVAANATAVAVTTAEAVIIASPAVAEQVDAPYGFVIEGYINYSPAATGTAITLKVRQGALVGGTQVGPAAGDLVNNLANPNTYNIPFCQQFGGLVIPAGNQFNLIGQGTTAGGTVNNVVIKVRALSPAGGP